MKDDRVYLRHICDAIARIESYVSRGRDAFLAGTMIRSRAQSRESITTSAPKPFPVRVYKRIAVSVVDV